ncbi:hypothetical protein CONPUDRAFT_73671 [Coniophora puteana RWD-64-598 SS2]|uniref:F-box domain-containing protein n=1 Tax=Coniophora puteana (strain RWD-64-598) TaxID=741705 RepID=A0A5M3MNF7_CONPW|nr:uncharacterized protein CONPUDRAFT_73671 [Coniophora puteana RWD-64-598 SS2]EIW80576.1 hypothetical protein CONPUDRAFT_73671 [Coniophora puteana RWD-64-598 SS2]
MLLSGIMRPPEMKDIGDQILVLSHVSQHWRDVAITMPQLWETFSTCWGYSPKKSHVFLERSQSALLDVSIDVLTKAHGWGDIIVHVLAQTSRFSTLSICTDEMIELPDTVHMGTVPFLIRLAISYRPRGGLQGILAIKHELFNGETLSLRSLSLDGCAVVWGSSIFSRLTELEIKSPWASSTLQIRSEQVIATLSCCASTLKFLSLDGCMAPEASTPSMARVPLDTVTLSLSRLRMLKLKGFTFASVVEFLTLVAFPHTTHLEKLVVLLTPLRSAQDLGRDDAIALPHLDHLHFSTPRICFTKGRTRVGVQPTCLTIRKPQRDIVMLRAYAESIGARLIEYMDSESVPEFRDVDELPDTRTYVRSQFYN